MCNFLNDDVASTNIEINVLSRENNANCSIQKQIFRSKVVKWPQTCTSFANVHRIVQPGRSSERRVLHALLAGPWPSLHFSLLMRDNPTHVEVESLWWQDARVKRSQTYYFLHVFIAHVDLSLASALTDITG